jgi:DNA-binding NarL/FixJ family response regulator
VNRVCRPVALCNAHSVRATRLIYVENDPALLGVMSTLLANLTTLEVLLATTDPLEALASEVIEDADVALIDLALGRDTLTGMDLGMALRHRNPHIGIVIHSQHPMGTISRQVPEAQQMGWSFLAKTGTLKPQELGEILRSTAAGMSHRHLLTSDEDVNHDLNVTLRALTPRQRTIMGLASLGMSAPEIGEHLSISSDSARKDLSKAYRTLVPPDQAGTDVRTKAVLAYLALIDTGEEDPL